MGNGVSGDQGNLPTHGRRDVSDAPDRKQHDYPGHPTLMRCRRTSDTLTISDVTHRTMETVMTCRSMATTTTKRDKPVIAHVKAVRGQNYVQLT